MEEHVVVLGGLRDSVRIIFPAQYRILGKDALVGVSGTCAGPDCDVPHGEALIYLQERD